MHHALEVQEILLSIFGHYQCLTWKAASGLADLARTCRAFKEPALDMLWEQVCGLSPLLRCLPEDLCPSSLDKPYSFRRLLTHSEWDRLRTYTCRIRSIQDMRTFIGITPLTTLFNPPTADLEPLFPNLRHLRCVHSAEAALLLYFPLPSLVCLDLEFEKALMLQNYFEPFSSLQPNIKRLSLQVHVLGTRPHEIDSKYFCHWKNLQSVRCHSVSVDGAALMYMSRMSALTELEIALSGVFPDSDSPMFFSNLHHLSLHCSSLALVSRLLFQIRLPLVTYFSTLLRRRPAQQDILSFLVGLLTSNVAHTVEICSLVQSSSAFGIDGRSFHPPLLDLDTLRPSMAFSNLRRFFIDIEWHVGLTDSDLLMLASAWPHLEQLSINEHWGWGWCASWGITPNGLLQLLETCPSLTCVVLSMDTRGYTKFVQPDESAGRRSTLPPTFSLNVLNSFIGPRYVPAVAACFASIASGRSSFSLTYQGCYTESEDTDLAVVREMKECWDEVCRLVVDTVSASEGFRVETTVMHSNRS